MSSRLPLSAYLASRRTALTPPAMPDSLDPTNLAHQAQVAAFVQQQRALGAQGAASTILTGPSGVTAAATTQRKTLLGS